MPRTSASISDAGRAAMRRRIVIGLILTIAAAACVRLYMTLEWVEQEIPIGLSEAARRNPFLAAEKFLAAQGHEVKVIKSFSVLDQMRYEGEGGGAIERDHLVILVNNHRVVRGTRLDNLWQWLENGGAVVSSGHNPFIDADPDREDALVARLPVSTAVMNLDEAAEDGSGDSRPDDESESADESIEPEESGESDEDAAESDPIEQWFAQLAEFNCEQLTHVVPVFPADNSAEQPFDVAYLAGLGFRPDDDLHLRWASDSMPHHLLRFRQGAGDVALLADANIWNNDAIGCADHAYALARLAQGRAKVWFLVNMDAPSLWRLLWRAAPFAVLMLALALLLWLWNKGKRAAPFLPKQTIARRSFLEHVKASATFLWRHKQGRELVEQLRRDLLHAANRRYPGFAKKNAQQQAEFLSRSLELPLSEVKTALLAPPPATAEDFTLVVNRLQYIRNTL